MSPLMNQKFMIQRYKNQLAFLETLVLMMVNGKTPIGVMKI